ncbi:MAG: helix-turn-helix domain-containing protein [Gemmataceae bacterium]|nr:helix-turn-helix domain-containing protein [Gemmataceae bacterium]
MAKQQSAMEVLDGGFVNVIEAARLCNLSRTTLYSLMDAGRLGYAKFGRSRRIPRSALAKLVEECLVPARN